MTNINKIPLIFLLIIIFSCVSAVNADNPQQTTTDSDSNIIPLDPTLLYSGSLTISAKPETVHVNDTVQILVTMTNTGLVNWNSVTVSIPILKGLEFISYELPDRNSQNNSYNPNTGIWNINYTNYIERGQQKTIIINVKVLPEAAGKILNITAKFQHLVLEGYGIDIANQISARSGNLVVLDGNNGFNGTNFGYGNGTTPGITHKNPWANTTSGSYNTNQLVKLLVNGSETIYYTTNGKTPSIMSQKYTKPIKINSTTVLKFIAIKDSWKSSVHTVNYIIDKKAPKILSSTPKNNHASFSLTAPIILTFNEKICKGSQYSNIQVKNKNTGKTVTITKSVSGNKLTLKMVQDRFSLNNYQIYIPKGAVKDTAGNKNSKIISNFKTGKY